MTMTIARNRRSSFCIEFGNRFGYRAHFNAPFIFVLMGTSSEKKMNDNIELILTQLKALEPLIYSANDGAARQHFEALLCADFWEVGATGKIYDREFVLQTLDDRQKNPRNEAWETSDYHLRKIESHHYLVTYTLRQPTRVSRRATLWQSTEKGWLMIYHQGTVVV